MELGATPHSMVRTWAQVDLDAVVHNVGQIRGLLRHGAALMAVVKANAYGHGAVPVARAALHAGAQRLGVASVPEGLALRQAGIRAPIHLLGPCTQEEFVPGIEGDLTFALSSEDEIVLLSERTRALHQGILRGRRTKVNLLVDTGMGRSGFAPDELWPAAERVLAERTLEMEGAFTHFSCAEEPDPQPTREQVGLFRKLLRELEERGVRFPVRHAANSAATVFFPEAQLDLVRCGALLHGMRPWPAGRDALDLRPALSLHTRIVHLARRPVGWTVGYNRTFRCQRESILATLPVGYRDGYRRALSGKGEVLVRGCRVPVIGTISMDYAVADVTGLAFTSAGLPELGEEVTLVGASADGRERISIEQLAEASGTIPYVVTTQLTPQVERRYQGGPLNSEAIEGLEPELRHLDPLEISEPVRSASIVRLRPDEDEGPKRMAAGA